MREVQKIIKYLAIAFALFLTFSIVSGIIYGISFIGNIFDDDKSSITEKLNSLEINNEALLLDINVSSSNIKIIEGDAFKAKTNNKYISSRQDKNKLYITEKKHNWFHHNKNNELIIYVPANFIFDGVAIETGAGKLNIETLSTKRLYLDLGAGKAKFSNLIVSSEAEINGGAGEIVIDYSNINNLDLDMGVGKLSLTSKLTGNSKIDSGIGKVDLSLMGSLEDYQITLDKGLGSATIDGNTMNDDTTYGTGYNKLDIEGGIGSINIELVEE